MFHGADMPFNEAIGLKVVWTGIVYFEAIFISVGLPFLRVKGLSVKISRGIHLRAKVSVRQLMTAVMFVEDIWNGWGILRNNI